MTPPITPPRPSSPLSDCRSVLDPFAPGKIREHAQAKDAVPECSSRRVVITREIAAILEEWSLKDLEDYAAALCSTRAFAHSADKPCHAGGPSLEALAEPPNPKRSRLEELQTSRLYHVKPPQYEGTCYTPLADGRRLQTANAVHEPRSPYEIPSVCERRSPFSFAPPLTGVSVRRLTTIQKRPLFTELNFIFLFVSTAHINLTGFLAPVVFFPAF
jgi:hypothetical protein